MNHHDEASSPEPKIEIEFTTACRARIRILLGDECVAGDVCDPGNPTSRRNCIERLSTVCPSVGESSVREEIERRLLNPPQPADVPQGESRPVQGRPVEYESVTAWEIAVELGDVLDELVGTLERFVTMPRHAAIACALWVIHTWAPAFARHLPRLAITAPTMRAGKSTLLRVLGTVVFRPQLCDNMTVAVLFRVIEAHRPTLLLDECDRWMQDPESSRAIIGIVNSGHMRGGSVLRCVGDDFEPRCFAADAPLALAAIGSLAETIRDRSITVRLQRRASSARGPRLDNSRLLAEMLPVRRRLARWILDRGRELDGAEPALPDELNDRAQDNWRGLCAIADLAGGEWPERAREAARALSKETGAEEPEPGIRLLSDALDIYLRIGGKSIWSRDLATELRAIEESPWNEWNRGRGLTPSSQARLLNGFHIVSRSVRSGEETAKGYPWDAFRPSWERYFARDPRLGGVTPSQAAQEAGLRPVGAGTVRERVTAPIAAESAREAACDGVTAAEGRVGG